MKLKKVSINSLGKYPHLGTARCGLFGISEDYTESYLSLDELLVKNKEATFFFTASSCSMIPTISEGDILIVDCSQKPASGDVIVADLDGERVCKRLYKKGEMVRLYSDNKRVKPLDISEEQDFKIFGPVVSVIRRLK